MRAASRSGEIARLVVASVATYLRVTASFGGWRQVGFDKRLDSSHIVPSK
jgi:hypothetical protein